MRYALIADIHGNADALAAVLKDTADKDIDHYIFVGDYFTGLHQPNEVMAMLNDLPNKYVVRGNNEQYILNIDTIDPASRNNVQFDSLYWTHRELHSDSIEQLHQMPVQLVIDDPFASIHVDHWCKEKFHKTPLVTLLTRAFQEYRLKHQLTPDECKDFYCKSLYNSSQMNHHLSNLPHHIFIYGHNHIQFHAQINDKLIINPGSCGIPLDGSTGAPYTLLETSSDGYFIEEVRAHYDIESTIQSLQNSSLYQSAWVWSDLMIHQLKTASLYDEYFLEYIKSVETPPYSKTIWEQSYHQWCAENKITHYKEYQ